MHKFPQLKFSDRCIKKLQRNYLEYTTDVFLSTAMKYSSSVWYLEEIGISYRGLNPSVTKDGMVTILTDLINKKKEKGNI